MIAHVVVGVAYVSHTSYLAPPSLPSLHQLVFELSQEKTSLAQQEDTAERCPKDFSFFKEAPFIPRLRYHSAYQLHSQPFVDFFPAISASSTKTRTRPEIFLVLISPLVFPQTYTTKSHFTTSLYLTAPFTTLIAIQFTSIHIGSCTPPPNPPNKKKPTLSLSFPPS